MFLVVPEGHIEALANHLRPQYPVRPAAPDPGVTTRMLRRIPLDELRLAAWKHVRKTIAVGPGAWSRTNVYFRGWARDVETVPRPGRAGRADLAYAQAASAYVKALVGKTPTKTLAADMALSESQVRNVLHEARRRDLLTAAPRGRAGGELTEKARRVLAEAEGDN